MQDIKALDDLILRSEVDHPAVSVQLLEDQLRLSTSRVEAIKNQAEKFEINIQFLEPCAFESIAKEAAVWKKFLDSQVGPPHEGSVIIVICNYFVKHLRKVERWETRGWESQRSLWAAQQSDPFV